jgi:antitoxin MazE
MSKRSTGEVIVKTRLKKWGNSPSVRIPAEVMRKANLSLDQRVEVEVVDGIIQIRPVTETDEPDLDEMIARLTPDNLQDFISTGPARGGEIG